MCSPYYLFGPPLLLFEFSAYILFILKEIISLKRGGEESGILVGNFQKYPNGNFNANFNPNKSNKIISDFSLSNIGIRNSILCDELVPFATP